MRIYYNIPDSSNDLESKMMGLLYENYSLRIQLALAPVQKLFDLEKKAIIFIERHTNPDSIELRYEGFTEGALVVAKMLIAQIKEKQKVRF